MPCLLAIDGQQFHSSLDPAVVARSLQSAMDKLTTATNMEEVSDASAAYHEAWNAITASISAKERQEAIRLRDKLVDMCNSYAFARENGFSKVRISTIENVVMVTIPPQAPDKNKPAKPNKKP